MKTRVLQPLETPEPGLCHAEDDQEDHEGYHMPEQRMGADRPSLTPCNDQNDQRNVADYSGSYPAHLSLMGNISNIALFEGPPQDRHSKSEGGLLAHEE